MNFDLDGLGNLAGRVGIPGAILLIVALGIAIRGPALLAAVNGSIRAITAYRLKRRELEAKIAREAAELDASIQKRLDSPPKDKRRT